jgi:hypothetical protein
MSLVADIKALGPLLVNAAQEVLDDWEQDVLGEDPDLGTGGPCDRVANAMADVISQAMPDAEIEDGGHDGDDHAYVLVTLGAEQAFVDIPSDVYETGGGYVWKKKPGVRLTEADIMVGRSQ